MKRILSQIEHIVVLMLENRSFDNLTGWTYAGSDQPDRIIHGPYSATPSTYDGLGNGITYANRLKGKKYQAGKPCKGYSTPSPDPHEPYNHVNVQLFGTKAPPAKEPPAEEQMVGFLKDYYSKTTVFTIKSALQILEAYRPEQIPVLNGLARGYSISDRWFSSVPTQTNPNRAFLACGTSLGAEKNTYDQKFKTDTIWNTLADSGDYDWAIYYHRSTLPYYLGKCYTEYTFPHLDKIKNSREHFCDIENFYRKAKAGTLPSFSFLEPAWVAISGGNGNDYHPPANVQPGERFVRKVYDNLRGNAAAWKKTLLVVTFDEHGGIWDHVPPPWNATNPDGKKGPTGFNFKRFGVRVPTLLISPLIKPRTVFRSETDVPYDHTSIVASILKWKGIDPASGVLGRRVAKAPTFENVVGRTARKDVPELGSAQLAQIEPVLPKVPLNDLQKQILPLIAYNLTGDDGNASVRKKIVNEIRKSCRTEADLRKYVASYKRTHPAPKFKSKGPGILRIKNNTPSPLYIYWGWDKGAPPLHRDFYLNPGQEFSHDCANDILDQFYSVKVQYWNKTPYGWKYLWQGWKPLGHHQSLTMAQPKPKAKLMKSRVLQIHNRTPSPIYVYWGWNKGAPPRQQKFYLNPGQTFSHDASRDLLNQQYSAKVQYWTKHIGGWTYLWKGWKSIGHKQKLVVSQPAIKWAVDGILDPCS